MIREDFSNIWEIYGLRFDPFYVGPILVVGGEISKSTFIGREKERDMLIRTIRSKGGSRTIVAGEPGVGKTSFVNVVRATARERGFFTPIKEIAVQREWNANDFILNTLFSIFNTLIREKQENILSNKLYKELEMLSITTEIDSYSGSISIIGTGGGIGKTKTRSLPPLTTGYLTDVFERTVAELISNGQFKEIIIHYNNLENFEPIQLQSLFNKIRDFLLIQHVHYIFIGDLTVPTILQSIPRVNSVFNDSAIILESLSYGEILNILKIRIKEFVMPGFESLEPFTEQAVRLLYDLFNGNIRSILNSLSIAIRIIRGERPVIMTDELLKTVLYSEAERRWISRLKTWEKQVLLCILENDEITNKQISQKLEKLPQNISKVISKLYSLNAIYIKRIDGTQRFLAVQESIKWFLLKPKKTSGGLSDFI